MSPPIPPAVRVVCGRRLPVTNAPGTILSPATEALRAAANDLYSGGVGAVLAVFPVPGAAEVVAGIACTRAPMHFAAPNTVSNDSPMLKTHRIAGGGFGFGPTIDADSGVTLADVLPTVLEAAQRDARWQALGAAPAPAADVRHYLLTDDGQPGDLVWGVVHWRSGATYSGGRVQTWTRDTAPGEEARLVGVSFAHVDAAAPITAIDATLPSQWNGPGCQAAAAETVAVMFTEKPFSWWLVA